LRRDFSKAHPPFQPRCARDGRTPALVPEFTFSASFELALDNQKLYKSSIVEETYENYERKLLVLRRGSPVSSASESYRRHDLIRRYQQHQPGFSVHGLDHGRNEYPGRD
jgi:hypothetical protein